MPVGAADVKSGLAVISQYARRGRDGHFAAATEGWKRAARTRKKGQEKLAEGRNTVLKKVHVVALVTVLVSIGFAAQPLVADDYPSRPIADIVASTPGGGTDIVSRIFGEQLSKQLGQPFVVENLAGAGSLTGTVAAARATPDGYTLQTGLTASMAVNPSLFANLPYDPVNDFEPVGMLAEFPFAVVVNNNFPAHSIKELIDARQGQARRDQLCLRRQRHRPAFVHGIVQDDDRHQSRARALSRRRAGLFRCVVRSGAGVFR